MARIVKLGISSEGAVDSHRSFGAMSWRSISELRPFSFTPIPSLSPRAQAAAAAPIYGDGAADIFPTHAGIVGVWTLIEPPRPLMSKSPERPCASMMAPLGTTISRSAEMRRVLPETRFCQVRMWISPGSPSTSSGASLTCADRPKPGPGCGWWNGPVTFTVWTSPPLMRALPRKQLEDHARSLGRGSLRRRTA